MPTPLLWGDETTVRERLGERVADIGMGRRVTSLEFPFSVSETVEFYRTHYGPTLWALPDSPKPTKLHCDAISKTSTSVTTRRAMARQASQPSISRSLRRGHRQRESPPDSGSEV